jgi:1-acyl-sn-glycerol-3-phosphate acyltransferase
MGERQMQEARVIPLRGPEQRRRPARTRPVPDTRPPVEPTPLRPLPEPTGLRQGLSNALGLVRKRLAGDYSVDEFGFDQQLTDNVVTPPLKVVYDKWFRVEARGTENLPAEGGALIVSNHSGTLPVDSIMTAIAVHENTPNNRHLRMLGADLVFQIPVLGALARKTGQTLACTADAERLLHSGELVGVWPEGFKGVGKPFKDRYKLQRFGRGGFVSAALRTGVPIIPVSVVGAEEIYPKIGDLKPLARLFGLPYFPITPTWPLLGPLGAIPLPSKWYIEFGAPIRTDEHTAADADDPAVVFNLTDQVRETIQQTIYRLLDQRPGVFRG